MGDGERTGEAESRTRAILRLLGTIVLAAFGLMAVAFAICWFLGWRTASQIGSALTWAGTVAIIVGLFSIFGNWGLTRDAQYMWAQSVSQQNITERTRLRSYSFPIVATAAGIICLIVGALL